MSLGLATFLRGTEAATTLNIEHRLLLFGAYGFVVIIVVHCIRFTNVYKSYKNSDFFSIHHHL